MNVSNNKNFLSEPLKKLTTQKKQWQDISERIAETKKQREKAKAKKPKKSKAKAVLVTGATSKQDIRRLRQTLNQKIGEVMRSEDNPKLKEATIQILRQKIDSLGRILRAIEQDERERVQEKREKRNKTKESVYLTSDDLTVDKSKGGGANDLTGVSNNISAQLSVSSGGAATATASVADVSAAAPTIDVLT